MDKKQEKMIAVKEALAGIEQHISDMLDFNDPDDYSQISAMELIKESVEEYLDLQKDEKSNEE